MKRIGITGGIGTGKSTVCRIFELLGIPVYYADQRAKALMTQDSNLKSRIIELFGKEAYDTEGRLNRSYISSKVFKDQSLLSQLNHLVHPAVGIDFENWSNQLEGQEYCLKEAALIFETNGHLKLDKVITVYASEETKISRVMKRDNVSREEVLARINKQMKEEEKVRLADYIINNDGNRLLIDQVLNIHHWIKA